MAEDPSALPASAFLNRAVRGIVAGLTSFGSPAHYFGRDFITIDSGQAAFLSFEISQSGSALLECVVAGESHWWLPEGLSAHAPAPVSRGNPPPAQPERLRQLDGPRLLKAIGRGYQERFQLTVEMVETAVPSASMEAPPDQGLHWSPTLGTAAGSCEAGVRVEGDRIARVALRGDLLADSAGIALAEEKLQGAAIDREQLISRIDAAFADGSHALLGAEVVHLVDAILGAARQQRELETLAEKYQSLVALRAEREEAAATGHEAIPAEARPPRRERMRRLASRFPGALRELDTYDAAFLERRLAGVTQAISTGERAPWMAVMISFHAALAEGLELRAGRRLHGSLWATEEEPVRRPPTGRLLDLVWRHVEARHGLRPGEAEALVYPSAPDRPA